MNDFENPIQFAPIWHMAALTCCLIMCTGHNKSSILLLFFTATVTSLFLAVTNGNNFTDRIIHRTIPDINQTIAFPRPTQKWPGIQVVIEDDNEIKLTTNHDPDKPIIEHTSHHRLHDPIINPAGLSEAESTPFSNFFKEFDFMNEFDLDSQNSLKNTEKSKNHNKSSKDSTKGNNPADNTNNNNYHGKNKKKEYNNHKNDKSEKYITAYESPPRYLTPKLVNPSFSKIPDEYLRPEPLNMVDSDNSLSINHKNNDNNEHNTNVYNNVANEFSNEFNSEASFDYGSPKKNLVVPVGSCVHLVKYRDYRKPEKSEIISKLDYNKNQPYEPSVIELPSSQPVLPIVFNFKTSPSPIFTKTTHFGPSPHTRNYPIAETRDPPQLHQHIVHKPIIQDLREIIVPYRFYLQEMAPVEEFRETLIPVNANPIINNDHYKNHLLHSPPTPILQADLHNPFLTSPPKLPVYTHDTEFNKAFNSFDANTFPASSFATQTEHLVPVYTASSSTQKINVFDKYLNMDPPINANKNPYMDDSHHFTQNNFHHPPYRVSDLYQSSATTNYFHKPLYSSPESSSSSLFSTFKGRPTYLHSVNHFNY